MVCSSFTFHEHKHKRESLILNGFSFEYHHMSQKDIFHGGIMTFLFEISESNKRHYKNYSAEMNSVSESSTIVKMFLRSS